MLSLAYAVCSPVPVPALCFGVAQECEGLSQFSLLIQLEFSWFSSHANTDRAETQDGSFHYLFFTNDLTEG